MKQTIKEGSKAVAFVLGIILLMLVVAVIIAMGIKAITYPILLKSCDARYEETHYNFFGGCMVKYDEKFITEKLYIKAFERNLIINKK